MGERGPVPKHPDERRRRNKDSEPDELPAGRDGGAPAPPAPEGWHYLAAEYYTALQESDQAADYQPSDWAEARVALEILSRLLKAEKLNGQLLASLTSMFTRLLSTEGDRRRAGIVFERSKGGADAQAQAGVVQMDQYRKAANG